jgi:NADPH-dependent 2,4-dienoyl-CoA reductase/sulfur reductase-like enzyme
MRVVIVGAEAAGASAAAKARRSAPDAEIVVFEKSDVTSFGACGLPYFVGGSFDDPDNMISRRPDEFRRSGIDIRTRHEIIRLDPAGKTLTARDLDHGGVATERYDKLLIATGATPIEPPIRNMNLRNVFRLKTLEDGLALRAAATDPAIRDAVVIGGGFIGLETAEALRERGKNVRLFQLEDRVMREVFDAEATDALQAALDRHGVATHLSESVVALEGEDAVRAVVTDKGVWPADLVVLCVGVRPATAAFRDCGLDMLRNGAIVVDDHGRTNLPDVFAAGDCAAIPHLITGAPVYTPLATSANKLGRIVGENLAGGDVAFPGTLGTAAIRVFDVEAARTGLTTAEAAKAGRAVRSVFVRDKNTSNYVPGQTELCVKLIYDAQTRVLVGGQTFGGPGAALRANVLATAIWAGLPVDRLGMIDFLYAPPFSRPWDALNIAANAAK